jgi:cysteine desulfurase
MGMKYFRYMKNVYLDNAATTRMDERVLEAMMPYLKNNFGNASSVHKWGREAKVMIEDARDLIADFIGAKPSEIYFTSGGTEANNWALKGLAFGKFIPLAPFSRKGGISTSLRKGGIVSTRIEHSSVIGTLEYLKERFGFEVTYVNTDRFGVVNPEDVINAITDKTFLMCMMHSNNELGVINNVAALGKIAVERGVYLHTDSVQSIGKTKFNVNELNCTTATLSAHKIYGPKGIGALYVKKDTPIDKLLHGGKQERDRRGGTENVAGIAGFKKAIEILKEHMSDDIEHYKKLRERLMAGLRNSFGDKVIFNSPEDEAAKQPPLIPPLVRGNSPTLWNMLNISFNLNKVKIDPDALLIKLDMNGIAVSSGSACTSGTVQPSHVLKAIGYDDITAKSSLRVSFGRYNTEEEVDYFLRVLKEII